MRAVLADRSEFMPPPEPGLPRSIGLALLAHAVLMLALSWGLKWQREDRNEVVEAELWSSTVQQAAPREQAPPPPPPAAAPPAVQPTPPAPREPDIALERQRQAQERSRQQEAERQRQAAERRRQEQAQRQEEARKAAEQRRREEQAKARAEQQQEELRAQAREEQMRRIQGMAGATGPREATGSAMRSTGPSDSYAGRIRARVKPNIVYTDDIPGNPTAVVEVRLAPDGTIIGKRITKPSGVPSWDEAVLRALDRTQVLPRDVDGRVITPLELVFRPRD